MLKACSKVELFSLIIRNLEQACYSEGRRAVCKTASQFKYPTLFFSKS
ncbi:hypothetical protein EV13_0238 [Prochlorococcus sp. MIT 0702]|nr:hypothetical protein EV12_1849 [Prochlorococcus sp. MIT 0701]KGG30475.1 hypothetical protein EV13_0238 [Prochlorococcus sp. MIT 0702]KGG33987.1 hypothetical protein EV14_1527 [Prochlorococcus sp. MIT 0703]